MRPLGLAAEAGLVLGHGQTLESLNAAVVEIARTDIPVLILGESGTGKEVYARLLHRLSARSDAPLKKMTCSTLDPVLLLRQFPGDAHNVSETQGGTLFLDGIEELDLACQRALLSALPDSYPERGSGSSLSRLISSSSRDLEGDVKAGHFRKELYFRMSGVCLRLPPLRDRKEDISAFIEHFLKVHALDLNKTAPKLSHESMEILRAYDWPGNIRELENLARKMVALGNTESALDDIRINRTEPTRSPKLEMSSSLKNAARAASRQKERELILEALERTKWNRKRAARELQISYKALLYKLKQIG
jgi:two-component system response regulator AtoC